MVLAFAADYDNDQSTTNKYVVCVWKGRYTLHISEYIFENDRDVNERDGFIISKCPRSSGCVGRSIKCVHTRSLWNKRENLLFIVTLFFLLFLYVLCFLLLSRIHTLSLSLHLFWGSFPITFFCFDSLILIPISIVGWSFGRGTELIIFCVFKISVSFCPLPLVRVLPTLYNICKTRVDTTEAQQNISVCVWCTILLWTLNMIEWGCVLRHCFILCVCLLLYTCWWAYHDLYAPKPLNIIIIIIYWRPNRDEKERERERANENSRHERLPNWKVAATIQ